MNVLFVQKLSEIYGIFVFGNVEVSKRQKNTNKCKIEN